NQLHTKAGANQGIREASQGANGSASQSGRSAPSEIRFRPGAADPGVGALAPKPWAPSWCKNPGRFGRTGARVDLRLPVLERPPRAAAREAPAAGVRAPDVLGGRAERARESGRFGAGRRESLLERRSDIGSGAEHQHA